MAKERYTVVEETEAPHFIIMDEGYVYDRYTTREDAEAQIKRLKTQDDVAEYVSDRVDELIDEVKAKFPELSMAQVRLYISEHLS